MYQKTSGKQDQFFQAKTNLALSYLYIDKKLFLLSEE
jgi:hypothetical protein